MRKIVAAVFLAAAASLTVGTLPAQAVPQPACGYFSGYEDCGGGSSKMGPFQPAPEKPWVYPTDPPPVPDTGPLFPWPERAPKPKKPEKKPDKNSCSIVGILTGAC